MNRTEQLVELFKSLRKDVITAGISTASNLNFFYLEPQAKQIYPVFYPLLETIPRVNPMFNGMRIGGTAVNWKAIVGIDSGGYPALSEGNRNAFMKFQERDYSSSYKYIGKDSEVSFQAQQTGMGFEDNLAVAQTALLNALLNDEERMVLYGNSGTPAVGGNNGFVLGITPTPVVSVVTTGGVGIGSGVTLYVACVALSGWGLQLATTLGVQLPFVRSNADSSSDTINGGQGAISAIGASSATGNTTSHFTAKVAAVQGAMGYAWYSGTTNAYASLTFAGITPYPTTDFNDGKVAASVGAGTSFLYTGVVGGQLANAAGLNVDNSYNNLDFDGLTTWTFNAAGSAQPSFWKDLGGAGFTSNGDGTILEFEQVLDFLWLNYKITIDKIYLGGNLISSVSKAILTGSGGAGAQRIVFEADSAGKLTGGIKLVEYRSKYSNSGAAKIIPVMTHPWLPNGVVYFDLIDNPYPAAGNAIPSVRRIVSLEDHFSIKWPYRKLQHEVGVYAFETIEHYIPFGTAILTGAANKVN